MKNLERRINVGSEVKLEARADGQSKMIRGVGAVTYDGTPGTEFVLWDYDGERAVERILPGAFDKALSRPDDVRGLFNHDANQVLGRTSSGTMRLSITARGLEYEITPGNTTVSRDVQEHLDRKDVTGSSIAFVVDEERWTETRSAEGQNQVLREILSLTLDDTGPVTFPAYDTTTAGVRAAGDTDEAKRSLTAHRASLHPSTKQALVTAAQAVAAACGTLMGKLAGVTAEDLDADTLSAIKAADAAFDQCDPILDQLLGIDDDDTEGNDAVRSIEAAHQARLLDLAELE